MATGKTQRKKSKPTGWVDSKNSLTSKMASACLPASRSRVATLDDVCVSEAPLSGDRHSSVDRILWRRSFKMMLVASNVAAVKAMNVSGSIRSGDWGVGGSSMGVRMSTVVNW